MANRPTPTNLRKLSGSHPERINKREAKFRSMDSVKPLRAVERMPAALEEWNRVLPELVENGLLTRANLAIFGAYCVAYGHWMEAEDDIEERGRVIEEPVFNRQNEQTGHREKPNPSIAQAHQFMLAVLRHAIEFGMTPASATKVCASPDSERSDSFDEFIGGEDRQRPN
jgi:P27 family predicted phage terminase small subunit